MNSITLEAEIKMNKIARVRCLERARELKVLIPAPTKVKEEDRI